MEIDKQVVQELQKILRHPKRKGNKQVQPAKKKRGKDNRISGTINNLNIFKVKRGVTA